MTSENLKVFMAMMEDGGHSEHYKVKDTLEDRRQEGKVQRIIK